MSLFIFVLFTSTFFRGFLCSELPAEEAYKLIISGTKATMGQPTVLKKGDTLNLTCRVSSTSNTSMPRFKITIHPPYNPQNSINRVTRYEIKNAINIVIQNLQESDGGDYRCQAVGDDEQQTQLHAALQVIVKNKKCGPQMFPCSPGICIMRRFVCDGLRDCKDGEDESREECGPEPCESKLHCEDRRCIPTDWCCDPHYTPNCTVRVLPPCCSQLSKSFLDHDAGFINEQHPQGLSDMGFLQTTIYTVVGCAMAFMFIVTILVIAICRVHMKRSSLLSRCPGARGGMLLSSHAGNRASHHHHHGLQHLPLYDLDVLLNRSPYPSASSVPSHSGLLVTYNINNGVQFVGRPVDPPPYCEIIASPPREGPPPPYASHDNLSSNTPEASATGQDHSDCEYVPSEGDSLLGSTREVEQSRPGDCLVTVSMHMLSSNANIHSGRESVEEIDRSLEADNALSAVSLLNNDAYDQNHDSSVDYACSFGNNDRVGELIAESGLSVSSCESLVVAPKVSESQNILLDKMGITSKPLANSPHLHQLDNLSTVNKISGSVQGEGSFTIESHNQENPLQCLHDTFNNVNPNTVDAPMSTVGIKSSDTVCMNVENSTKLHKSEED